MSSEFLGLRYAQSQFLRWWWANKRCVCVRERRERLDKEVNLTNWDTLKSYFVKISRHGTLRKIMKNAGIFEQPYGIELWLRTTVRSLKCNIPVACWCLCNILYFPTEKFKEKQCLNQHHQNQLWYHPSPWIRLECMEGAYLCWQHTSLKSPCLYALSQDMNTEMWHSNFSCVKWCDAPSRNSVISIL